MNERYRIKQGAPGHWRLIVEPDGYWTGPGLGDFHSIADAMDWAAYDIERRNRHV